MQINWFEVIAQIINFFIILFLLHKLFYKPVIQAMESRQERISEKQRDADEKMEHANELIAAYEDKMEEIEDQKKTILAEAKQEAQKEKERLIEEYKEEAQEKGNEYLNELEQDKENYLDEVRRTLGHNAMKIASHILSLLSTKELNDEVFEAFLDRIQTLDEEFVTSERSSKEQAFTVTSAEEMSDTHKERLETTLVEKLGDYEKITYRVEEDLILGYELRLETATIHTNIEKYLDEAEENIVKALERKAF